ncbi:MAG: copper transporter [Nocardioidaceae bacterium]
MIDFRYHVISIVAIFLALATGVALGAGPLRGPFNHELVTQAKQDRQDKQALRADLGAANQQSSFQNSFVSAVEPGLINKQLAGRTVAIFVLPGASGGTVSALNAAVQKAGGTVTATLGLSSTLLDPGQRQVAEGLATQVLAGTSGIPSISGASSYQLVGISLARGLLTQTPQGTALDRSARTIVSSYESAKFLTTNNPVVKRANLALVVAGAPSSSPISGQDELVATLVQAIDASSGGAVVAGPATAAGSNGYVQAIRGSDAASTVSTVDEADIPAGQVTTVLALAEQAGGNAGQYGGVNATNGAMPAQTP